MLHGEVLAEISAERSRQDEMFGGPPHDDEHTLNDWYGYIRSRLDEAISTERPEIARKKLIAVAALAVAAIESADRKAKPAPTP
jgi:hypothetical protein